VWETPAGLLIGILKNNITHRSVWQEIANFLIASRHSLVGMAK
jgi:hypothetical protein